MIKSKRFIINCFKYLIGVALIVWVISQIELMSLGDLLSSAKWDLVLFGILCLAGSPFIGSLRWQILLRVQNIHLSYPKVLCFTLGGMFYNIVMPGLIGGDLAKTWWVTRVSKNRTAAAMTVVMNRGIGIISLATLGIIVMSFMGFDERFYMAGMLLFGFLGIVLVGVTLFYSNRLRSIFSIEFLISRIPGSRIIAKADEAVLIYRQHKGVLLITFFISVLVHLFSILGAWLFGLSLGITSENFTYQGMLALVPAVFILSSLPISPAGIGVGESVMAFLLPQLGATPEEAVGIMLLLRVGTIFWGLIGGLFVFSNNTPKSVS